MILDIHTTELKVSREEFILVRDFDWHVIHVRAHVSYDFFLSYIS